MPDGRARLKTLPVHVQQKPFFALGLRLASALAIATLFMLVKLGGEHGLVLPEMMFWRQAVPIVILLTSLGLRGRLGLLRSNRIPAHAGRAVSGMIGMACNFAGAMLLPLAVSTVFNFTTPLFAVILSALVLREAVGHWRWLSVALGFLGVLVIARPGSASTMGINPLGAMAGLGSGFMVALVSIQIRELGRTENPIATVFYFSLFGSAIMLAYFLVQGLTGLGPHFHNLLSGHDATQWAILLAIGVSGTVGQILLTSALRYGSVASVVVMDYTALIWTTIYGIRIFHQLPPATTWLGSPLIVAAGLVIAWREHRLHRLAAQELAAEA